MRKILLPLLVPLLFAGIASPCQAGAQSRQDKKEGQDKREGEEKRGRVFISPMGEPFRGSGEGASDESWFNGADKDRDGRLSPDEFVADASRFYLTLDVDADGEIDPIEISRYEEEVAPEIRSGNAGKSESRSSGQSRSEGGRSGGSEGDHSGGKPGEGPKSGGGTRGSEASAPRSAPYVPQGGAGRFSYLNIPEPVTAADTNWNRGISPTEFTKAADKRFGLLDADHDGALTRAELPRISGH